MGKFPRVINTKKNLNFGRSQSLRLCGIFSVPKGNFTEFNFCRGAVVLRGYERSKAQTNKRMELFWFLEESFSRSPESIREFVGKILKKIRSRFNCIREVKCVSSPVEKSFPASDKI